MQEKARGLQVKEHTLNSNISSTMYLCVKKNGVNLKEQKFFKTRVSNARNSFETTFYAVLFISKFKIGQFLSQHFEAQGRKGGKGSAGVAVIDL